MYFMARSSLNISKRQGFILYNALSFQCVWWTSVLFGNSTLLLSIPLLVVHFMLLPWVETARAIPRDLSTMLKVGLLGMAIDGLLIWMGIFEFPVFPGWLACLWLHFAVSLHHSLSFIRTFAIVLQAILGGVFGCLSYLAGARLYAVNLPFGEGISVIILAVIWAILLPVFIYLSRNHRLNRQTADARLYGS
ncbi:putative periplasmic protein [Shewanella decolorationis S12]|uniref:Periplasmic protein n=2 Tax=Shewanella decolorationis TaxID=256839 RepID=A0ABN0PP71_9GAMM|nr:putative periplasmic protein [Shewanella decolorationis S12]